MAQNVGGCGGAGGLFKMDGSIVTCSICLEEVDFDGGRSIARLHCGHLFHLDCIGSEFNARGVMRCPNCREVEGGQWLYANRGPEQNWHHDHGILHHIIRMLPCGGFQWGIEPALAVYDEPIEQHGIFTHGPNYNHHLGGPPVPSEIASTVINSINEHFHNLNNHFIFTSMNDHISDANQASVQAAIPIFAAVESESVPSPEPFAHPVFLDHGSGFGMLAAFSSSTGLPYSGSNGPAYDTFHIPQVPSQQPFHNFPSPVVHASMSSGTRVSNHSRDLVPAQSAAAPSADLNADIFPVLSLALPNQNHQHFEHSPGNRRSFF